MFRTYSCTAALSFLYAATSSALNIPNNPNSLITTPTAINLSSSELRLISSLNNSTTQPDLAPVLNLTAPNLPTLSRPKDVLVDCTFGHELEYNDCLDALNTFVYPPSRNLTIAQRIPPYVTSDLSLPVRWISGG